MYITHVEIEMTIKFQYIVQPYKEDLLGTSTPRTASETITDLQLEQCQVKYNVVPSSLNSTSEVQKHAAGSWSAEQRTENANLELLDCK